MHFKSLIVENIFIQFQPIDVDENIFNMYF